MFERFTNSARRTVVFAQEEARQLRHNYIGTEHILLGIIHIRDNLGAQALERLGVTVETVRTEVEQIIGKGDLTPGGHIPFTPRAKKALELSLREARQLGHRHIGTEHILLGLLREGEGVGAQVLHKLGVDLRRLRNEVTRLATVADEPPTATEGAGSPAGHTPAAEQVIAAARLLAGGSPIGSHHLLEALVRSEDSAAAKTLGALGLNADTLAAKIDELGLEGTSDLTEEEAAARQMEIRLADGEVHLVLRDAAAVELARIATEHLGGPVRGDDPVAGGMVALHQAIIRFLTDLRLRVQPSPEDTAEPEDTTEPEASGVSAVIRRAMQSRLRRRRDEPPASRPLT